MKLLILLGFIAILGSLAAALVFIMRDKGRTRNAAWALTCRVGLSIVLFALLWVAYLLGWIEPHGLPVATP